MNDVEKMNEERDRLNLRILELTKDIEQLKYLRLNCIKQLKELEQ